MSHAQNGQIASAMCFVRAYAKINLTLDVLGRRNDGYHAMTTIMQTIDLYDTLCLTATNNQRVEMICSVPELSNEDNLAVRAAQVLCQRLANPPGLTIELHKRIPVAAGLGGGSSDAAAVLLALQQWLHIPVSTSDLHSIAASLGSDVPFFLTGGLALCKGRGEQVTAFAQYWPASMRWLLLLKPAIGISTAAVFRNVTARDYTDGAHSQTVWEALHAGKEPPMEDLQNSLERVVLEQYPAVTTARTVLLEAGASLVRLSGSGPTLFAPFSDLASAFKAQQYLLSQGYEVYLSRAIHPNHGNVSVF